MYEFTGEGMSELTFANVYLSGQFNLCPCGQFYGSNDMELLKEHFDKGHYSQESTKSPKGEENV